MPSRRFALRYSKRLRIPKKRLDLWDPAYGPETTMRIRYPAALRNMTNVWMFLFDYYGSLLAIVLEFLVLTITGILAPALVLLRLHSRNVLASPATRYFENSMTNENFHSPRWQSRLRHLLNLNMFTTQWNALND